MATTSRLVLACAAAVVAAGCSREERTSTPLPTRQTTIDRVHKGLDAADQDAAKRRQELEAASNK